MLLLETEVIPVMLENWPYLDFLQKDALEQIFQVLPRALPLLSSHEAGWDSIYCTYHWLPTVEIPEFWLAQHVIKIYVGDLSTGQKLYCLQELLEFAVQIEHDRAEMV
jgi:hypothetical protein